MKRFWSVAIAIIGFFMVTLGKPVSAKLQEGGSYSWLTQTNISNFMSNINILKKEEIVVVVVDTGLDKNHEWFKDGDGNSRILDKYAAVCNNAGCQASSNYADSVMGNGTHVAGIIAKGTTSNVKIIPIKLDDKMGVVSTSALQYALNYAIQIKQSSGVNVKVINVGYEIDLDGSSQCVTQYNNLIESANTNGISVVVGAGNNNQDASSNCLVRAQKSIAVAALDSNMDKADFSNYGSLVDFAAPGKEIQSAYGDRNVTTLKSGTSMAAAHVSAQMALLYSACSNCSIGTINEIMRVSVTEKGYVDMDRAYDYMESNLTTKEIILSSIGPGKIEFARTETIRSNWIKVTTNKVKVQPGDKITFNPGFLCGLKEIIDLNTSTALQRPKGFSELQYEIPKFSEGGQVKLSVKYVVFQYNR